MLTRVTYNPRVEIPKLASVLLIIPTLTFVQYVGMLVNANQIFDQILWKCRSSVPHEDLRLEPPEIYILGHGFLIFLYILMQAVYALLILSAGLRMNAGHVSWLKRSVSSTSSPRHLMILRRLTPTQFYRHPVYFIARHKPLFALLFLF
jgi:hypothetical protein